MKYKFWILLIIIGGILMIVGSAIGSAAFYQYLIILADPYIGLEFKPLVTAILTVLEYIAFYGGYSVLVGVFLILIKFNKLGSIIITIATSFGLLGLIIYGATWIVGSIGIPLNPTWQTVLDTIYSLFTFNSGMAFAGTAIAVFGKFGLNRAEKAYEEEAEEAIEAFEKEESSSENSGTKFCPDCGAELPAYANFCNKCGKNFD
ncbi:MAG: zinc ribbon domain-containing protein [Candidatus Lokiarchaeota archaeon]|nr:zinc ribbon domain-containing protein [Candidatus Lokiarchaeota archaeon]